LADVPKIIASQKISKEATITDQNSLDCPDGVCEIPDELKPHIEDKKYELTFV